MKSTTPAKHPSAGDVVAAGGRETVETEREKREVFALRVGQDVSAVRRVADLLHDHWAIGGPENGEEGNIAAIGCRVMALALAQVEQAAEDAALPRWNPSKEPGR